MVGDSLSKLDEELIEKGQCITFDLLGSAITILRKANGYSYGQSTLLDPRWMANWTLGLDGSLVALGKGGWQSRESGCKGRRERNTSITGSLDGPLWAGDDCDTNSGTYFVKCIPYWLAGSKCLRLANFLTDRDR